MRTLGLESTRAITPIRQRVVSVPVLFFLLLPMGGCFSPVGQWQETTVEEPGRRQQMTYGSKLQVTEPSGDRQSSASVVRQPSCREYEMGINRQRRTRGFSQDAWPAYTAATFGVIGLGTLPIGLGLGAIGPEGSTGDSRALGDGLVGVGAVSLAVAAALIIPWMIMPAHGTDVENGTATPYTKWTGGASPCGNRSPVHEKTTVAAELRDNATKQVLGDWSVETDGAGHFSVPLETAQRVAPHCGEITLMLADTSKIGEPTDTPQEPSVLDGRRGDAVALVVPGSGARRPLATLAREDPLAEKIARGCCERRVAREQEDPCTDRCLRVARASKCANGRRACAALVGGSEFDREGTAKCKELLSTCIVSRGITDGQLAICGSLCVADKLKETCQ